MRTGAVCPAGESKGTGPVDQCLLCHVLRAGSRPQQWPPLPCCAGAASRWWQRGAPQACLPIDVPDAGDPRRRADVPQAEAAVDDLDPK
jgi:hypothetical protein